MGDSRSSPQNLDAALEKLSLWVVALLRTDESYSHPRTPARFARLLAEALNRRGDADRAPVDLSYLPALTFYQCKHALPHMRSLTDVVLQYEQNQEVLSWR